MEVYYPVSNTHMSINDKRGIILSMDVYLGEKMEKNMFADSSYFMESS